MIQLHLLVFLAVLELLAVFVVLWLVWFFKYRKLARQLVVVGEELVKTKSEANAAAYFAEELHATQVQLDSQAEADPQVAAALGLRSAYLTVEHELSQGQRRDPAYWTRAQETLAELLAQFTATACVPMACVPAPEFQQTDEEEAVRVKRLFDAQIETINQLKLELAALAGDSAEGQTILTQLDKITHTNREMAMCVSILEDDNTFLRDQIAALLKTD